MDKVKTDIEFENFLDSASDNMDDPIVLAYRFGDSQRTVRLRRSEVLADAGLVEVGKTAQALGYDPQESLNRDVRNVRPADSYIQ